MAVVKPKEAPYPMAVLGFDGTDFYVLKTDDAGHPQIDVLSTIMDAAAATAANQATMITALQLIDDLRNALDSVGTDELDVNVEGYDPAPSTPVWELGSEAACSTGAWTTVKTASVTAEKTWYITDFWLTPWSLANITAFEMRLSVGGTEVYRRLFLSGMSAHVNLNTPRQATAGQAVLLEISHEAGSDKAFRGGYAGFEV